MLDVMSQLKRKASRINSGQRDWPEGLGPYASEWTTIDDDGYTPATEEVMRKAAALAERLKNSGFNPPTRICLTPNGEVSIEWADRRKPVHFAFCVEDSRTTWVWYRGGHGLQRGVI